MGLRLINQHNARFIIRPDQRTRFLHSKNHIGNYIQSRSIPSGKLCKLEFFPKRIYIERIICIIKIEFKF